MRKRLMILALVLIAVLMTCTLAACSGGGGRCSGGHTWDEGTVKEAATCTESGTLINKCTVCGIKREVAIEALGHDLQTIPGTVVEPTCEVDGYAGKKACVREGCEYVLDTGTIIPAIGHAYGDWTSNGDGTHKRVCSNDSNHVESGNCSGGTADCGHKAVCDVCGGEYGDYASSHAFDKQVTTDAYKATDATCEAKATYYYSCQCGEKGTETFEYGDYADHVFDREVADAEYLVSVATCTSPAIYNKSCACGLEGTETFEYGNALPHTFDNEVASDDYKATDATCTKPATYYYSCDCGAHGTATFAYGDMLAHVYDKEVAGDKYLASAATCEKKATYYKSCYCGHFDVDVSATFESGELGDHVYDNKVVNETYKATDATCTKKATYYFSCDCGKAGTETFESGETLPHVYDKEVTEGKYLKFAANCASAAVYYKSCACGHFDTETSPTFYFGAPSGKHVFDRKVDTDYYKATDATCTAKATYYYSCECGEKGTTTFESGATLDHTMTHTPAKAATCVSTGNVEYWTCSTCSLDYDSATGGNVIEDVTTAIDSTNHVHTTISKLAVAPDCENTGLTAEISCADCETVIQEREEIPALGHDMGDWFVSHEPTCTVTGVNERTCKRDDCDYFETEAIPTIAHSVTTLHPEVPATCIQKGTREYYECENCDKYVVNDGEFKTSWGDIVIKVDATNHVHTEKLAGKAANCTETGLTEGEKCTDCGATIKAQEEIPALGHKGGTAVKENVVAATCTTAGSYDSVVYCSVCNAEVSRTEVTEDATGHTPVKNVCSCGYEYSVDEIIALAEALAKGDSLNGTYRLSGVITNADAFNTYYNSVTVAISVDGATEEFSLLCYGMKGEDAEVIGVGDTITVSGEIKNHYGTIEFNTGCALESYIPAEFEVYLEVFGKGTVSGIPAGILARGDEVTFTVTPDTANKYEIDRVTINGSTLNGIDGVYTFIVTSNTIVNVSFKKEGQESSITTDTATIKHTSTTTTNMSGNNDAAKYFGLDETQWTIKAVKNGNSTNIGLNKSGDFRLYYDASGQGKGNAFSVSLKDGVINSISIAFNGNYNVGYAVLVNGSAVEAVNGVYTINASSFTIQNINTANKQVRINSISVTYAIESTSGNTCAHENWSDYVVTTPATCSERGVETATCLNAECGETKTRQIPVDPTLHVYSETITTPATCTQPGLNTLTCECGDTKTEEIAATGHNYNSVVTAPTCTADGYTTHTCSVCGDTYKDNETEAKGHTEVVDAAVEATCTETGLTEGKHCSVCGEVIVAQEEVKALGHDEITHEAKAPTCTEKGWDAYVTCSRCDYSTYVEKAATGHKYDQNNADAKYLATPATCVEKATYYKSCSCGHFDAEKSTTFEYGEIAVDAHDWDEGVYTEPTCTADGYTTYTCKNNAEHKNVVTKENSKLDHSWVETSRTEATCVATGAINFVCEHDNSHTKTETIGINANAHDLVKRDAKAPTCTEIGWDAYEECSRCDYTTCVEKSALGHNEVEHEAKAPTCTEKGWDAYVTCSRCDHSTYVEKAATGHKDEDRNNVCDTCKNSLCDEHTSNKWESDETHHWHICTACGFRFGEVAHTAGEVVVENEKDASCTEAGSYDNVVYCTVCSAELSRETITVDATDHDYQAVVTAPTCTTDGYTTHTCSKCKDGYVDTTVEALDHDLVTAYEVVVVEEVSTLHKVTKCVREGCEHIAEDVTVDTTKSVEVANEKDLRTVLENGFNAQLAKDVDLVKGSIDLVGVSATLDLNGHNISVVGTKYAETTDKNVCGVFYLDGATLTVDGEGELFASVDKADSIYVISAINGSNVTLNGGTYRSSGCTTIYGRTNTTITINGGTYIAEVDWEGLYFTLDILESELKDGTNATINVYGGTFHNFDPANHTNDGTYTNKVMDGYHSIKDGDNYVVSEHIAGATVKENITNATCTETGKHDDVVYCTDCNAELSRTTVTDAVIAHTEVVDAAVAPKCEETGLTEGKHCSVCGEVLVAQETVDALGHDYVGSVTTSATCEGKGVMTYTCQNDNAHTYTEEIAATGHTTVVDEAVAPKCEETGLTEGSHCSVCNKVFVAQNEVAATGHTEGEVEVENNVDPTCTEAGSYDNVVYCTVCNAELSRETITVEAKGHTEVIDNAVAPTCVATGLTKGKHCSVCNEVLVAQEKVDALGHNIVDDKCTVCGLTYTNTTETISFADTTQRVSLSNDSQVWKSEHVTFTNNKGSSTSSVADHSNPVRLYKYSTVNISAPKINKIVINSSTGEYFTNLQASIKENDGYTISVSGSKITIEFNSSVDSFEFTCSGGQCRFISVVVTYKISSCSHVNYTEVTPEVPATCTANGTTAVNRCNSCGEEFGGETILASHDMGEWTTTKAATCTTAGERTRSCNRADCDHAETETIDATGHNYVDGVCTVCSAEKPSGETPAEPTVVLEITKDDFNGTSYAANNNEKTEGDYSYTSYQVMKQSDTMQWQKSKGYITITSNEFVKLELKVTAGTYTVTVGGTTVTGTTSNGVTTYDLSGFTGEIKISVGSALGNTEYLKFYK